MTHIKVLHHKAMEFCWRNRVVDVMDRVQRKHVGGREIAMGFDYERFFASIEAPERETGTGR